MARARKDNMKSKKFPGAKLEMANASEGECVEEDSARIEMRVAACREAIVKWREQSLDVKDESRELLDNLRQLNSINQRPYQGHQKILESQLENLDSIFQWFEENVLSSPYEADEALVHRVLLLVRDDESKFDT